MVAAATERVSAEDAAQDPQRLTSGPFNHLMPPNCWAIALRHSITYGGGVRRALGDELVANEDLRRAAKMEFATFFDHHFEGRSPVPGERRRRGDSPAQPRGSHAAWRVLDAVPVVCRPGTGSRDPPRQEPTEQADSVLRGMVVRPGDATLHNNRGKVLDMLGLPDEAIAEFENTVRAAPDYFMAYTNLMHVQAESASPKAADATLRRLFDRNPPAAVRATAHNHLGLE